MTILLAIALLVFVVFKKLFVPTFSGMICIWSCYIWSCFDLKWLYNSCIPNKYLSLLCIYLCCYIIPQPCEARNYFTKDFSIVIQIQWNISFCSYSSCVRIIFYMAQQLASFQWYPTLHWSGTKTNFPSNLNYDGKSFVEWAHTSTNNSLFP